MRSRLSRLGVVVVGILALLGVATPPAHAATAAAVSFTGTAVLSTPIGYPCVSGGLPTLSTLLPLPSISPGSSKCSPFTWGPPSRVPLPLPTYPWLQLPNAATFTFSTSTCLMVVAHITKPAPTGTTVHTPSCTLSATGIVLGFCGLSQGHGTATITDPLGFTYSVGFHWTGIGGNLVIDGQVTKFSNPTQRGTFLGLAHAIGPEPITVPGQSCLNKTARTFTVAGGGVIVTT